MSNINCIIIEDEPLAVKILTDYVEMVSFLELKATFKDAILATEYLSENHVDLIFLDIHLPRLKGMAFLKTLLEPPAVIVTTAYHQYAVEGFELNVTDYLLKPFGFERFLAAVNKVKRQHQNQSVLSDTRDYIIISVQKKKVKVALGDILYIESQKEYVKIVCTSKVHLVKLSTVEMEAMLPATQFSRIHRSFIVSVEKVESYTAEYVEINGTILPIGRGFQGTIEKLLGK